jgi:hypothetical protein
VSARTVGGAGRGHGFKNKPCGSPHAGSRLCVISAYCGRKAPYGPSGRKTCEPNPAKRMALGERRTQPNEANGFRRRNTSDLPGCGGCISPHLSGLVG